MSKKDYQFIADIFRKLKPVTDNRDFDRVLEEAMDKLAADNPRFDRERFEAACK